MCSCAEELPSQWCSFQGECQTWCESQVGIEPLEEIRRGRLECFEGPSLCPLSWLPPSGAQGEVHGQRRFRDGEAFLAINSSFRFMTRDSRLSQSISPFSAWGSI